MVGSILKYLVVRVIVSFCFCFVSIGFLDLVYGQNLDSSQDKSEKLRIHDEYESAGGESISFGGAGASIVSRGASIKINPAGLSSGRIYAVEGGYHIPTFGEDFYQIGIVDNKTSSIAAGFMYTDFKKNVYKRLESEEEDTPVKRRFSLAFASAFNEVISLGVGANYTMGVRIEKINEDGSLEYEKDKGITAANLGTLINIGSNFKIGISAENLFASSMKEYNPKFYRFGTSYLIDSSSLKAEFNLDYRGRQRLSYEKELDSSLKSLEHMVFVGSSVTAYDILKLMLSYGRAISEDRTSLGFGLSLIKNDTFISLGCLYPYFNVKKKMHSSVSLSYAVVL